MKSKKTVVIILSMIIMMLLKGNLPAQSSQTFINVKVDKDEKKYAASLLLENTSLNEIIKILNEHTGAQIKVIKPAEKNKKLSVEFHFIDKKAARNLAWHTKKATVKTYFTEKEKIDKPVEINIKRKNRGEINIKVGKQISVEYINIRLSELLERFSELGKIKFILDDKLKKQKIRINLKMKNFSPEEALKALANMENLKIKKLDDDLFLVTTKQ